MPQIYRKVILGHKTNMFKCSDCLDKDNLPQLDWDDTILPGNGNPGVWEEEQFPADYNPQEFK